MVGFDVHLSSSEDVCICVRCLCSVVYIARVPYVSPEANIALVRLSARSVRGFVFNHKRPLRDGGNPWQWRNLRAFALLYNYDVIYSYVVYYPKVFARCLGARKFATLPLKLVCALPRINFKYSVNQDLMICAHFITRTLYMY